MEYCLLLFFLMIFLHIVDDFYLQGKLSELKQKLWWRQHPQYKELYRNDHIPALIAHAFSWSFMILLPYAVMIFICRLGISGVLVYTILLLADTAVHAYIDHVKANLLRINLVTDQLLHLGQIVVTFAVIMIQLTASGVSL